MSHSTDGTASFVGMELVKGVVSGKSGSFVIGKFIKTALMMIATKMLPSFRWGFPGMPNTSLQQKKWGCSGAQSKIFNRDVDLDNRHSTKSLSKNNLYNFISEGGWCSSIHHENPPSGFGLYRAPYWSLEFLLDKRWCQVRLEFSVPS